MSTQQPDEVTDVRDFPAAPPSAADAVDFRDFTRQRKRFGIRVQGEFYEARPALGLAGLQRVASFQEEMKGKDAGGILQVFAEIFRVLLKKEAAERFMATVMDLDNDDPIDQEQLTEIVTYLVERHTGRPTQPPSDSSVPSDAAPSGTGSTDGAPPAASTP